MLALTIKDDKGNDYQIQPDDSIIFTIKKTTADKTVILQKSAVNGDIKIKAEETALLPYGTYCYDVELRKADGTVATVITPSPFILCEEVTF